MLQLSHDVVKFLGHRVALHAQFGSRLVHKVDGLVGKESVADVSLRQFHRRNAGIVLDTHLVVVLVAFLQSSQNAYCRHLVRLVNHHGLETAFQSLVFLEILLVFVERGGTDGAQFASCESRFQDVSGIHGTLSAAGTHEGVNLINKENYAPFALRHLVDDALQTLLKLAFILCAGKQGTHVKAVELLVLQILRHVTAHYALCQSLHDGCLTSSRFTYKNRIVLCASRKNLQHTSYFVVTAYHRVQFSGACVLHQVLGIFGKTLVVVVCRLALHVLSLAQFLYGLARVAVGHSRIFHNAAGSAVHLEQREDNRLHADKFVAHLLGNFLCLHQHLVGVVAQVWLSALNARLVLQFAVHELLHVLSVHTHFLEEEVRDVLCLCQHSFQEMSRFNGLLARTLCHVHRLLNRLLCFDCKVVKCHSFFSFLFVVSANNDSNDVPYPLFCHYVTSRCNFVTANTFSNAP